MARVYADNAGAILSVEDPSPGSVPVGAVVFVDFHGATNGDLLTDLTANPTDYSIDSGVLNHLGTPVVFAGSGGGGAGSGYTAEQIYDLTAATFAEGDNIALGKSDIDNTITVSATGVNPDHAYYQRLAAFLEPDAIEYLRTGTFTYAINSTTTKYFLLGWNCYIDPDTGARYEIRNPNNPLPLRNVTIKGATSTSFGLFLDTTLPTYADARDTYFDRLEAIAVLDTKKVYTDGTSTTNYALFLPGPYGSILTSVLAFEYAWVALGVQGLANGSAFPLDYELADDATKPIRFQHTMNLPVTKGFAKQLVAGYSANANSRGVITYVILPSTWSAVTDPLAPYDFRDDFMGATLDTGVWTKVQSTAGNVEINTAFQWCKAVGNASWGTNGAYKTTGITRTNGLIMVADVYMNGDGATQVGWYSGSGVAQTDLMHGLSLNTISGSKNLRIIDNGTDRGTVGTTTTSDQIYRVRITLSTSGGAATYEIQGGTEYPPIGGSSWTTLTGSGTGSADNTLHPGFSTHTGTNYVGDVRVYS